MVGKLVDRELEVMWGKVLYLNLRYYPDIYLGGLSKTKKT
jgi:hypothetical protein